MSEAPGQEPTGDDTADDRQHADGVDELFLGVPLPLPVVAEPDLALPATHQTVLLRPDRRLAAVAAVDLDGARLVDVDRSGGWRLDPRAPAEAQTGPEVYARNDLDRGHLIRRRDPCWGPQEVAEQASRDTFTYPNAAPQVAVFNQSKDLWLGLEDHVLHAADAAGARLRVLTGPVLVSDDPVYRGCALPRSFWKVAAWRGDDGGLAATGYLLDQSDLLAAFLATVEARPEGDGAHPRAEPDLGAYRTFQVAIADLADLTGLDLGPLPDADRGPVVPPEVYPATLSPAGVPGVELTSYADVRLA